MDIYEVFRRSGHKEPFMHCGAVTAPGPEMALYLAKECFLRRGEGEHLWIVPRSSVHSINQDPAIDVVAEKPYRHPSGYRDVVEKRKRAIRRAEELTQS